MYITISPSVETMLADQQWLLGDDCFRVDFNRARIRAGLQEWNNLFERPNVRLRTVYLSGGIAGSEEIQTARYFDDIN